MVGVLLQQTLAGGADVRIEIDTNTNGIVAVGSAEGIAALEALIGLLDVPQATPEP